MLSNTQLLRVLVPCRMMVLITFIVIFSVGCQQNSTRGETPKPSQLKSPLTYPLKGATVADDFPDYTSEDAGRLYDSLKAAGIEWVAITPCGFIDSTFDTSIGWTAWSRRDYSAGIRNAINHGMKVMVKPMKSNQKHHLPRCSLSMRPVAFGNQ